MKEHIAITVDEKRLALNDEKRERLARTERREPTDRTPVVVDATFWTILPMRGVTFGEFIASPRAHLREQILNFKWRVENVRDDQPIETERLTIAPDFGALRGTEFPMEIEWQADQPPKTKHLLTAPEQIDDLALPDPAGGLNTKKIEFYHGMKKAVDDFDVRLNGKPIQVQVSLSQPGGPIPSAFALCGPNLFLWLKTDPERVQRLMDLVTRSHQQCIALFDELAEENPRHSLWLGADSAEMMSARDFRAFAAPYYNRLWEQTEPPRVFHMCGRINHLLDIIRDDLRVDRVEGFGFPTSRDLIAEKWSGRLVMRGGPHPMLIHDGPRDAIIAECESYIRTAGRRGGFILSEGFGLMPGTPPAHIDAMVEASIRVGSWAENKT
ncbi:MAG: uroporphyrinogen decarboxylase family protein [Chloroflexota bacterium]